MMVEPLYAGTLRGKALRFFRAPHGEPDLPWHAFTDLLAAVDLPRRYRRVFEAGLGQSWKAETKMVDTEAGLVTIAPHFVAQGFIDAMIEAERVSEALTAEYTREAVRAMDALAAHLPDPGARFHFAMECASRSRRQRGELA
jgi:hypothetical protein